MSTIEIAIGKVLDSKGNLASWAYAILVNVPYFGIMNVKKIYFLKKLS